MEKSLKQITNPDLMVVPFMRVTGVQFRKRPAWFEKLRPKKGQIKPVSWFDHYGRMKENPDVLVVEPYGSLMGGDLKELQTFCDEHGLDYMVFPTSAYSPTQTMHVRIWPRHLPAPDF
jgi:hypothetical protein